MIEDGRAILVAGVTELRVGCEWIDVAPENIEQPFIADFFWIIGYLDGFSMAGAAGHNLLVSRILFSAADVAGGRREHAFELIVRRFHAPEAAPGKRGFGRTRAVGNRRRGVHQATVNEKNRPNQ